MSDLERLLAIEEIKALKARYFRCMDTKDWAGLEAVFAPDAEFDMRSEAHDKSRAAESLVTGAARIAVFMQNAVKDLLTVHHGHTPEIEITSPTTARGIWAMEDLLRWPAGSAVSTLHGFGHYHETYEKVDGHWRIRTLTLTRLRVDAS